MTRKVELVLCFERGLTVFSKGSCVESLALGVVM